MRAEKEVSDAVKPGNRPAPLLSPKEIGLMRFPIIQWMWRFKKLKGFTITT